MFEFDKTHFSSEFITNELYKRFVNTKTKLYFELFSYTTLNNLNHRELHLFTHDMGTIVNGNIYPQTFGKNGNLDATLLFYEVQQYEPITNSLDNFACLIETILENEMWPHNNLSHNNYDFYSPQFVKVKDSNGNITNYFLVMPVWLATIPDINNQIYAYSQYGGICNADSFFQHIAFNSTNFQHIAFNSTKNFDLQAYIAGNLNTILPNNLGVNPPPLSAQLPYQTYATPQVYNLSDLLAEIEPFTLRDTSVKRNNDSNLNCYNCGQETLPLFHMDRFCKKCQC